MRLAASLLLLLSLAPAPLDAQSSGLLLGVAGTQSRYRTLWIAPRDGRLVVVVDVPTLVVPRDDGFWRVDVHPACQVSWRDGFATEEEGDSVAFLDRFDVLVRHPLGAQPPRDSTHLDCAEAQRRVTGDTTGIEEADLCYWGQTSVTHVSPRLVSWREAGGLSEHCEPGRYTTDRSHEVTDWNGERVSLVQRMAAAQATTLQRRFDEEKGPCSLQDSPDEAWAIVRAFGGWKAEFQTNGSVACRGDSGGEFTFTVPVPATLARRDDTAPWFLALRRRHGAALADVFVSPRRDLVVARVGDRLLAHVPKHDALGEPVLTLPLSAESPVVMAEWATGAHVARWTRELSDLRIAGVTP